MVRLVCVRVAPHFISHYMRLEGEPSGSAAAEATWCCMMRPSGAALLSATDQTLLKLATGAESQGAECTGLYLS